MPIAANGSDTAVRSELNALLVKQRAAQLATARRGNRQIPGIPDQALGRMLRFLRAQPRVGPVDPRTTRFMGANTREDTRGQLSVTIWAQ